MWSLTHPIPETIKLKFTPAGQENASVTQLWDGGVQLINALEWVNWEDFELQFIICETCGVVGCQSQGWVSLRRSHHTALILPSFTRIDTAPSGLEADNLPPEYLLKRGAIWLEAQDYQSRLRPLAPFPEFSTLPLLTGQEAIKIYQLEAPMQILGHVAAEPHFNSELIVASSEGNFIDQTAALANLLKHRDTSPVLLRQVREQEIIISFYLDVAGFPEWKALVYDGTQYRLYLEPGFVVVPSEEMGS